MSDETKSPMTAFGAWWAVCDPYDLCCEGERELARAAWDAATAAAGAELSTLRGLHATAAEGWQAANAVCDELRAENERLKRHRDDWKSEAGKCMDLAESIAAQHEVALAGAGELAKALKVAVAQCREHDSEYQHSTPRDVLLSLDATLARYAALTKEQPK